MPTGIDTLLTRGIRIHTDLGRLALQSELLPRVLTRIQTICVPNESGHPSKRGPRHDIEDG